MPKRLPAMPPVQPTLVNKAGYQRGAGIVSTAPPTPSREGRVTGRDTLAVGYVADYTLFHYSANTCSCSAIMAFVIGVDFVKSRPASK